MGGAATLEDRERPQFVVRCADEPGETSSGYACADPEAGFDALVERGLDRELRLRLPAVSEGGPKVDDRFDDHVQGLAVYRGPGLATHLAVSRDAAGGGYVLLAEWKPQGLVYRGHFRTKLDHPGGMQAWGRLLAIACESEAGEAHGRLEIHDPSQPDLDATLVDSLDLDGSHGEPLPIDPATGSPRRTKVGWVAFTELDGGPHLLLLGGNDFGRTIGWLFAWHRDAEPGSRFRYLASYGNGEDHSLLAKSPATGKTDRFDPGITHNAAFVAGPGGEGLYFVALSTRGKLAGIGRPTLHRLEKGDAPGSFVLVPSAPSKRIRSTGKPSFRTGATVHAEWDGSLTMLAAARNPKRESRELAIGWTTVSCSPPR